MPCQGFVICGCVAGLEQKQPFPPAIMQTPEITGFREVGRAADAEWLKHVTAPPSSPWNLKRPSHAGPSQTAGLSMSRRLFRPNPLE